MSETVTLIPEDYVPRFTKEEVLQRIAFIAGRAMLHKQKEEARHPGWHINIDPIVLIDVAKSAMDDIWRYKMYHLRDRTKRSDAIKRAAYFVKWIVRLRPLSMIRPLDADQFAVEFDKEHDYSLLLNESFAVIFAMTTIATECAISKITLTPQLMSNLLYDLHYRVLSDDALMTVFSMIRARAKGADIIMR